jgi:small subunit ribosomal protein S6
MTKMVGTCGGEILVSRLWNEQKLAYPIKGHRKGAYWLSYFRLESTKLTDFNRACRLEDDILRSLTLRVDPRLVEALVAHAKGERIIPRPADEPVAVVAVVEEEEGEPEAERADWVAEDADSGAEVR